MALSNTKDVRWKTKLDTRGHQASTSCGERRLGVDDWVTTGVTTECCSSHNSRTSNEYIRPSQLKLLVGGWFSIVSTNRPSIQLRTKAFGRPSKSNSIGRRLCVSQPRSGTSNPRLAPADDENSPSRTCRRFASLFVQFFDEHRKERRGECSFAQQGTGQIRKPKRHRKRVKNRPCTKNRPHRLITQQPENSTADRTQADDTQIA